METIDEYLNKIYQDLQEFAKTDSLCILKCLTFQQGSVPQYGVKQIQQLYLLRYAFAYAFEYSHLYETIMSKLQNPTSISVTSIGCGTKIDYWALVHTLDKLSISCHINYKGIDSIKWEYCFENREGDEVSVINDEAINYFKNFKNKQSDVYLFPKSISELKESELKAIVNNFPSDLNKFYIGVTLRKDPSSKSLDNDKINIMITELKNKKFKSDRWDVTGENISNAQDGITKVDNTFHYPKEALEFITKLNEQCISYETCEDKCKDELNRRPILTVGYVDYCIIEFQRSEESDIKC